MKNLLKLFGIIALAAVVGFSLTACKDPDDGGGGNGDGSGTYTTIDSEGRLYTLEITPANRSARAAAGDTFKLTVEYKVNVGSGELTVKFEYSGTVGSAQNQGEAIVIKIIVNGEELTITIEGAAITVIIGKVVNNDGETVVVNPEAVGGTKEKAIDLEVGVLKDGYLTASGVQWYKFTTSPNSRPNRLHLKPGTLDDVNVELYTSISATSPTGSFRLYSGSNVSTLYKNMRDNGAPNNNQTYYIKITPNSGGSGSYKMGFNYAVSRPISGTWSTIKASSTSLTANTWASGNISNYDGDQWFHFSRTQSQHTVHLKPGAMRDVWEELYKSNGSEVNVTGADATALYLNGWSYAVGYNLSTTDSPYYIRVYPYWKNDSFGNFQIAASTTDSPPQ